MYNLTEAGGGVNAVSGGAGIVPTVNLGTTGGGAYPVAMPVMGGMGGCGFGGGFGGDGIWAILLLALLGRGGFGGCDGGFGGGSAASGIVPTLISDNLNGRFNTLSDQISSGDAAIIANNNSQSIVNAVRDVDGKVCDTQMQLATQFGNLSYQNCQQGNAITSAISNAQYQNALGQANISSQLATCCCDIRSEAQKNTCDIIGAVTAGNQRIIDTITTNKIESLRDALQAEKLANSQCAQNAYLLNALSPRPVPAMPVYGNSPIFQPVVSADTFCGFGNSSFNRGGCGNGCL